MNNKQGKITSLLSEVIENDTEREAWLELLPLMSEADQDDFCDMLERQATEKEVLTKKHLTELVHLGKKFDDEWEDLAKKVDSQ